MRRRRTKKAIDADKTLSTAFMARGTTRSLMIEEAGGDYERLLMLRLERGWNRAEEGSRSLPVRYRGGVASQD